MSVVSVPEEGGGRLGVAWGAGHQLVLHSKHGRSSCHEVRWEVTLYEPIHRKLVNESLGVFLSLSQASEEERPGQLVRASRQYRSIMKDCQEQLEAEGETSQGGEQLAQADLLYR